MVAKGPQELLTMRVIWPPTEDDPSEFALAVSSDVFDDFAGEEANWIKVEPRRIGKVALRDGHILLARGNTKAHSGEEVHPHDINILDDVKTGESRIS